MLKRFIFSLLTILLFSTGSKAHQHQLKSRPNIIFILADDVGWNDVGFTGNSDLQTPNIDALAYNGRILTRHYALPICSPSRASLFTGRYATQSGMQGYPISAREPRALSLYERLMPQYFKDLGYQTHLVGKWHLGHYDWKYTPTARGAFDTFFGHLNGLTSYYDHILHAHQRNVSGYDFWRNMEPQYQLRGRYVTDLLTEESVRLIESTAKQSVSNGSQQSAPLFLMISHLAVHAGNPGEHDLEYPVDDLDKFSYISNIRRRKLAAMAWNLDKSVGRVVKCLADNNMLTNSIIIFVSDNGAPTIGLYANEGSNFPFKGVKLTTFEGAVHTTAAVWSTELHGKGLSRQLFHISDWLPTLFHAAGGNVRDLSGLEGRDQWHALLQNPMEDVEKDEYSARQELLVHMDEMSGQESVLYRNWKLIDGSYLKNNTFDDWFGNYTTENYQYQTMRVSQSEAAVAFMSILPFNVFTEEQMLETRRQTTVDCNYESEIVACNPIASPCLYDLATDPCERINKADLHPDIVAQLKAKLDTYRSQLKPQLNVPYDDASNPVNFNATWMPWQGSKTINKTSSECNQKSNNSHSLKPCLSVQILIWIYFLIFYNIAMLSVV